MPDADGRIQIAILGGGMGGLATAWRLTEHAADRDRYCITVYQRDGALGGKGASFRNLTPGFGLRIEEHGLHLLLGFYNSALGLLRRAYGEVHAQQPTVPLPAFDDVLEPWDDIWMAEQHPVGTWVEPWLAHFPTNTRRPGVDAGETDWFTLIRAGLRDMQERVGSLVGALEGAAVGTLADIAAEIAEQIAALPEKAAGMLLGTIARLLKKLVRAAWPLVGPFLDRPAVRRGWIAIYLLATNLIGLIEDDVLDEGTDGLDRCDYADWLQRHQPVAAPPHLGCRSAPVLALYDLAFSRRSGLAAGVTVRAVFRMLFGYAGHFSYKMRGGMGEIVFAPLYLALAARGVTFNFHHEVTALHSAADGGGRVIEAIDLRIRDGVDPAATPLRPVTGSDGTPLMAWPRTPPDTDEPRHQHTLRRGADFDVAVLAVSIGAFAVDGALVGDLCRESSRFAAAVADATTVGTQAAQLWMTRSGNQIGWPHAPDAMLISYERPCNAWVDMSHLIGREGWTGTAVAAVHYLCDELHAGDGETEDDVRENTRRWLEESAPLIWPQFTFAHLYDPDGGAGAERLRTQYFRANDDGSDRYVTVGPASVATRLAPADTGFRNLAVAGDWVRTELSCGCLEAATEGGLGAGEAIRTGKVTP